MAGNIYIAPGTGTDLQKVASSQTSAGAGSAGNIVALNSSGLIDGTMLPGADLQNLPATEAIAAGAMVNIYSASGTPSIRNADNSSISKMAHGWAPTAITSGTNGNIYVGEGQNTAQTGLTVGSLYYLGTVGAVTTTPPTTSGTVVQRVGVAQTTTLLQVLFGPTIGN